jgi:hypothetical protein
MKTWCLHLESKLKAIEIYPREQSNQFPNC